MEHLSLEQRYLLHRIAIEVQDFSREELVGALLDCWEGRFRQKQAFLVSARDAGFSFQMNEGVAVMPEVIAEDFEETYGYVPSEEETEDYLRGIHEKVSMEIDMDEIVLGSED